jgi:threonine dehydratase
VRVVAVETEQTAGLHASLAAGRRTEVDVGGVAADSLGARRIGAIPWEVLRDRVESVVVTDVDVMAARQDLWDRAQLVTEPGGAAAHAALLGGAWRPRSGERTVVVACGANTDPGDLVARD